MCMLVAFKRFVENVLMNIDYELLKGFSRSLDKNLLKEFKLSAEGAEKRCASLLQENPYTEIRREELYQDIERLKAARKQLRGISAIPDMTSGAGDSTPSDIDEIWSEDL